MYLAFKRFLAWGLIACLPLVVAGCGGGGGGGTEPLTTISGIAVKGPISGAAVAVYQLKPTGSPGELLGTGTSGIDGKYSVNIPVSKAVPPLLIRISGQPGATYKSEMTNNSVPFGAQESFNAVVDTIAVNQNIAVSPLSEAAYQNLQQVLTANPAKVADVNTVAACNTYIASVFNVTDILADPTISSNIANLAALQVIDQMVIDSGTGSTLATMNLIGQAVADVSSPAYQSYAEAVIVSSNTVLAQTPPTSPQYAAVGELVTVTQNPPPNPDFSDTTPPSAPGNLSATPSTLDATHASAILSWTAATDNTAVTGYEVFRDGNKIATVSTAGFTDSTLIPGSVYTYYVIAFDGAGNRSAASNTVSVTPIPSNLNITVNGQLSGNILSQPPILDLTQPTAPTGLSATASAISATSSQVVLKWTAATDNKGVTGYEIYRNSVKVGTASTVTFTDATIPSAATYVYYVLAVDAAGNRSLPSNQVSVTPPAANLGVTVSGQVTGI